MHVGISPMPVIGKRYPTHAVGTILAKYPTAVFVLSFVILAIVALVAAFQSDPDFDAFERDFMMQTGDAAVDMETANAVAAGWLFRLSSLNQSFYERSSPIARIELRYVLEGSQTEWVPDPSSAESNILGKTNMELVRDVERAIWNNEGVQTSCLISAVKGSRRIGPFACAPLASLTTYFFPGNISGFVDGQADFANDGLGSQYQQPYGRVLRRMSRNPSSTWFLSRDFSYSRNQAIGLRSQLILGEPAYSRAGRQLSRKQLLAVVYRVARAVLQIVDAANAEGRVKVSAGGDIMSTGVLLDVVSSEGYIVAIAFFVILGLTGLRTKSFFFSIVTTLQVALSYASTITIFTATISRTIPLIGNAAVLLTAGIAMHTTFLTLDTFKSSGQMATSGRRNHLTLPQRLSYTMRHATWSSTMLIGCTMLLFAALTGSPLRGVSSAAAFTLILLALQLVSTWSVYPAAVSMYHWHFSRNDRLSQRQIDVLQRKQANVPRRHPAIRSFFAALAVGPDPPVLERGLHPAPVTSPTELEDAFADAGDIAARVFVSTRIVPTRHIVQISRSSARERCLVARQDGDTLAAVSPTSDALSGADRSPPTREEGPQGQGVTREREHSFSGNAEEAPNSGDGEYDAFMAKWNVNVQGITIGTANEDAFAYTLRPLLFFFVENMEGDTARPKPTTKAWSEAQPSSEGVVRRKEPTVFSRVAERWRLRYEAPRRFFLCGKRIAESRSEKDARIMNKVPHPRGRQVFESVVRETIAPTMYRFRKPLLVLFILLAGGMCYPSSQIKLTGSTQLITSDAFQRFERAGKYFIGSPSCDLCSNYYRPLGEFSELSSTAAAVCAAVGAPNQASAFVDSCGTCFGSDACYTCNGTMTISPLSSGCSINRTCTEPDAACGLCDIGSEPGFSTRGGLGCRSTCDRRSCVNCNSLTGLCDAPCQDGSLDQQSCRCGNGSSGEFCDVHSTCSERGRVYSTTLVPAGAVSPLTGCGCLGAFAGPLCQFCKCRNGGECSTRGVCTCKPGFGGRLCEQCAEGCQRFGACPLAWTATMLPPRTCVPSFCHRGFVENGTICAACRPPATPAPVSNATTEASCWALTTAYWDGQCYTSPLAATDLGTCTSCRGWYRGPACACAGPAGSECLPTGDLRACDGKTYSPNATETEVPVLNACGACSPKDVTWGCGARSSSRATIDAELVLMARSPDGLAVDSTFLTAAAAFCHVARLSAHFLLSGECWLPSNENMTGADLLAISMQRGGGNLGFSSTEKLNFVYFRIPISVYVESHSVPHVRTGAEGARASVRAAMAPFGAVEVLMPSHEWRAADLAHSLHNAFLLTIVVGIAVACTVSVGVLSLPVTVACVSCVAASIAASIGCMQLAGWPLDALVVVMMPVVIAVPVGHAVHLCGLYIEELDDNATQLLARGATRQGVTTATLARSFPILTTACLGTILMAVPALFSSARFLTVAGLSMVFAGVWSVVFCGFALGVILFIFGPTMHRRRPVISAIAGAASAVVWCAIVVGLAAHWQML